MSGLDVINENPELWKPVEEAYSEAFDRATAADVPAGVAAWIEDEATGTILRCLPCESANWFATTAAAALAWAHHVIDLHPELLGDVAVLDPSRTRTAELVPDPPKGTPGGPALVHRNITPIVGALGAHGELL